LTASTTDGISPALCFRPCMLSHEAGACKLTIIQAVYDLWRGTQPTSRDESSEHAELQSPPPAYEDSFPASQDPVSSHKSRASFECLNSSRSSPLSISSFLGIRPSRSVQSGSDLQLSNASPSKRTTLPLQSSQRKWKKRTNPSPRLTLLSVL
jgi:hypothetical protein